MDRPKLEDLVPADIIESMAEDLEWMRSHKAHGSLEFRVQNGHVDMYYLKCGIRPSENHKSRRRTQTGVIPA